MEEMRLNKFISLCGVCSRRDADRMIEDGLVKVNGEKAGFGMKVGPDDEVLVFDNETSVFKRIYADEKVVIAYNKPAGVTCTSDDPHAERTIYDVFDYPIRLKYAGRLDKDAEGLLIMTNDGDLIEAMMKGRNDHEKEYIVRVNKDITDDFIEKMSSGVYLNEVNIKTKPCKVEKVGRRTFRIILTQGVNRQIKRMSKELGFYVNHIKRVRVVNILLADLKTNEYRVLTGKELQVLYNTVYKNASRA